MAVVAFGSPSSKIAVGSSVMRLTPYKRMTSLEIVAATAIHNEYYAMTKRRLQVGISVPFVTWLSNPDALLVHYCWENNAVSRTISVSEMSICDAAHRIRELDALARKSGCSIVKLWAMVNTASDTGTFNLHCFRRVETAPSRLVGAAGDPFLLLVKSICGISS